MVDANGYGEETETLALRKGLDSGSDVAGVQDGGSGYGVERDTVRFASYSDTKVKCQILAPGLRLALVVRFPKILAFRKELGSWYDVTGSARWWIRFMVKCEILVLGLGLALVRH
ncbi:Fatty Acid Desaturase 6 [Manis pentadactyla]|nr:Fatty Acid Desaturase 6 [Manis pentadactyla]